MEKTARPTELVERLICKDSKVYHEARPANIAILSRWQIQMSTTLNALMPEKLQDFDTYPLSHRAGLMHCISEDELDLNSATIVDVNFMGLFPKSLLVVLRTYKHGLPQDKQDDLDLLISRLLSTFIYRPILLQKIIHYLTSKMKLIIAEALKERDDTNANNLTPAPLVPCSNECAPALRPAKICFANKCRLLKAKGIIQKPMLYAKARNMCSGCIYENSCQRKTKILELEIMESVANNVTLSPLLQYRHVSISIKNFRKLLRFLPSMSNKGRDDSIYGAAEYIANTLGMQIENYTMSSIDEPMSPSQINEKWRQATFSCRCQISMHGQKVFGKRAFCSHCSFLVCYNTIADIRLCPACNFNESWEIIGSFCLACNRFQERYQKYLEQWLPPFDDLESDDNLSDINISTDQAYTYESALMLEDQKRFLKLRSLSIDKSFDEIRTRSSIQENRFVFENLHLLQKDIRSADTGKQELKSQASSSISHSKASKKLLPQKRNNHARKLFSDESQENEINEATKKMPYKNICSTRPPLLPLALNIPMNSRDSNHDNYRKNRNAKRMAQKKDKKKGTFKKST
jgi:hypothetical protein